MEATVGLELFAELLVFAVPAVASASHGKHHHGARHSNSHRHHAKGARLLTFAPATAPASAAVTTACNQIRSKPRSHIEPIVMSAPK